jgi:hypothetical protein
MFMKSLFVALVFLAQASVPPVSGTISGRFLSADGTPAADVRVAAMVSPNAGQNSPAGEELVSIARTDADGFYRLERLPPGRYYVTAGPVNFRTYYPGVTSVSRASAVDVAVGASIVGMDFSTAVFGGGAVSGRLLSPTIPQTSVFPATVTLSGSALNGRTLQASVTEEGAFQFPRVPPGLYVVRDASAAPGGRASDSERFSVADNDVTGVQFLASFHGDHPFPGQPESSWAAIFDGVWRQVTLTGVITSPITQIRPPLPYAFFSMDVTDKTSGTVTKWWVLWIFAQGAARLTNSPEAAKLEIGSSVTLSGEGARDGSSRVGVIRESIIGP